MDVLVTGATGLVGANVARLLAGEGHRVRALVRASSSLKALEGCPVEVRCGDILEPRDVADAMVDCAWVFHVAGDYRLWAAEPSEIYRNNVDGTRTVLEACARAGVERVVYTSSVATLGPATDDGPRTEAGPVSLDAMIGPYARSKFLAERVAEDYAARGLPVVIVNPSACFGPWDVKPTPTGRMILDFLRGRMLATLDTGLNVVHVSDVARGHLLAATRGRVGEKYILAGENHSLTEVFDVLARITGIRPPRLRLPYRLIHLVALASEGLAAVTRHPPRVPLSGVRIARKPVYASADKAVRELGLAPTPSAQALRDAVDWFVGHRYAPVPPAYRPRTAARG
jgi:dihydroflavonol-4-reductase